MATFAAILRVSLPSSRSSERTPASRVYPVMVARSAASVTVTSSARKPGPLDLARQQVPLGDEHLLVVGVAVEADELHAVEQRRRDGVGDVGGGDEHHVAEVELDLEVVIAERVVLRRVEHFEQRRGRVAAPATGAQLVDLVEQDDGVHRAGLDDRPGDATGLAADVGSPVTTDLGLVAHAAERDPHELAAHRPSDGLAEAGLADAGRTDERHHDTRLPGVVARLVGGLVTRQRAACAPRGTRRCDP